MQRIRYRDGQELDGRDLRDDGDYESRMRGLHTRALHDTWGIALGLGVSLSGDRQHVLVAPGLAYDIRGNELLLADALDLPVPAGVGSRPLVLAIRAGTGSEDWVRLARGACLPGGSRTEVVQPVFLWQTPARLHLGEDVPLATLGGTEGSVMLQTVVRRNARPLLRPYMGWGTQAVTMGSAGSPLQLGELTVDVDTSDAGFTDVPFYFAVLSTAGPLPVLDSIEDATSTGFTYRLLPAPEIVPAMQRTVPAAATVFWLGVEPVTGCEPVLDLTRIFTLAGLLLEDWKPIWGTLFTTNTPASGLHFAPGE
jgi:hypothetical protein